MDYNSLSKYYLKYETVQILIRSGIALFTAFFITYIYKIQQSIDLETYTLIMFMHSVFLVLMSVYMYLIVNKPYFLQRERIVFVSVLEVVATVFVMYLVGSIAAYFVWLLLWYIIGYGARYGRLYGYITFVTVIVSWFVLSQVSPYWQEHQEFAFGWLATFVLISLYFFFLLKKLHGTIEQLHEDVDAIEYRATHDTLTRLPNRALFELILQQYVEMYVRNKKHFALVFIDLDNFKNINDTYGHEVGDKVLVEASNRLIPHVNFSARLGGDEFVSLLHFEDTADLRAKLQSVIENLTKICKKKEIELSASIGAALYPDDTTEIAELKRKADRAMYKAKKSGKNRFCLFQDKC